MSTQQEVFDVINNLFHIIDENKNIWFYAKELCKYLEYNRDSRKIINDYIKDESQKITYSKIKNLCGSKNDPHKNDATPKKGRINYQELFINEDAVYELISKSTKPNAQKFVKWTRKIISQIRKGDIKVDGLEYKAPISYSDSGTPIFFDKSQCHDKESIFYNEEDEDVLTLKMFSKQIDYKYYLNKNVLYLYTTSIRNIKDKRLIIKIGYSKQIQKRTEEHKARFGADFKLIAIKEVNDIDDEQVFHAHIKFLYPELVYYFQIKNNNGKNIGADEFYIYDERLLEEFFEYDIKIKTVYHPSSQLDIEHEKLKIERLKLEIELFKLKNGIISH